MAEANDVYGRLGRHLDGILSSTGENLLTGNGTVSHLQAMEKDYLENIKLLEEKGKNEIEGN